MKTYIPILMTANERMALLSELKGTGLAAAEAAPIPSETLAPVGIVDRVRAALSEAGFDHEEGIGAR